MKGEAWLSVFSRVMFVLALLLFLLAGIEKLANLNGRTIAFLGYTPGRLLEFSGIMLLFVITVTLRRIRSELHARRG